MTLNAVENSATHYSQFAVERAMKVQEVILRAMAGKLQWWHAAEIIGVTDRTMRRWRQRYAEHGYDGLFHRQKGKPSPQRVPMQEAEEVLRLYQERYSDFNVRHFHEKLVEKHQIELSYTWVKLALQGAGLVKKQRRRGVHRRRRARRPLPGMLLHIDGSRHCWFQDDRWHDLIVILDDATSEIYYAQLVEEESTRTVMRALREVIEQRGRFCALYSDRGSHFFVTRKAGEKVDGERLTQVGRASAGTHGAELSNLAGAATAGTADSRPARSRGSERVSTSRVPSRVQSALRGRGGAERECVCPLPAQRSGLGVFDPTPAASQPRQHGGGG